MKRFPFALAFAIIPFSGAWANDCVDSSIRTRLNSLQFEIFQAPKSVQLASVKKDTQRALLSLERMGIHYSTRPEPSVLEHKIRDHLIHPAGEEKGTTGSVLEITHLGTSPKTSLHPDPLMNALEHPEMPSALAKLKEMGYSLVVDTSLRQTNLSGAIIPGDHLLRIHENTSWVALQHELQHVEFEQYIESNSRKFILHVANEGKLLDILPPDLQAKLGKKRIEKLQALLNKEVPLLAVNETLSTDRELETLGFKRYLPFSKTRSAAINAQAHALFYQISELQKIRIRSPEQELALKEALNARRWVYSQMLFLPEIAGIGTASAVLYSLKDKISIELSQ